MPKRPSDQPRQVTMTPHYIAHPEGSVLIAYGDTRVICTASVEDRVPPWLSGSGKGWVTAEYDMLPRATGSRRDRDSKRGRINGRTQEISRLIGRSLRSVTKLSALGERLITVDCDVIEADGGTRTAAITGGYVALSLALQNLEEQKLVKKGTLQDHVAAISVGIVDEQPVLDLDYSMDSRAQVDMNVVMRGDGSLSEIQGTGEGRTFSREELGAMLDLAFKALPGLVEIQKSACRVPLSNELITVRL